MKRNTEILVGVTVILGIALIVFGTLFLQGLQLGREEVEVKARFREVGQLLEGSTVKLRGVPIGRVVDIELDPSGNAVIISMSIRADVRMPPDPKVVLSPESMFGDWQAEVVPGNRFAYDYEESPDPAVLPGYALPDISRLTAVADEIAQNLATISDRVERALTEETADNIRLAIDNLQRLSEQLNELVGSQQAALADVSGTLKSTSLAAGEAAETLRRTFVEVENAVGGGRLEAIAGNVERTTARTDSLTAVLTTASRDLQLVARSADSTFRAVGSIAGSVQRGEGSLGMLVRDTALYLQLTESSLQLQALLRDMRENPRKYINLTIF
ncbi:MAG TPA: MlaD family protein [Longimicrobiales bacterium]|nr:MlaD family protein [Longimicrobiales bacterium]